MTDPLAPVIGLFSTEPIDRWRVCGQVLSALRSDRGKAAAQRNDAICSTAFEKLTLLLATQHSILLISRYVPASLRCQAVQTVSAARGKIRSY